MDNAAAASTVVPVSRRGALTRSPASTSVAAAASADVDRRSGVVVAIPCYNEEVAIGSVVLRARQHAARVVVVDDGSSDRSVAVATLAGAEVVRHPENLGYGAALRTIFDLARKSEWDVLVVLDSDGQHDPDDIPTVTAPVLAGEADVSIGSRFIASERSEMIPAYRRFGIRLLTGLNNVGAKDDHRVSDGQSGFRAYSRRAVQAIVPRDSDMGIGAEILFQARKANLAFAEVPIVVRYDVDGSSQNPVSHGLNVIGSIVRYAEHEHPLIVFGIPGVVALLAGILLGAYSLTTYLQVHYLPFGPSVGAAALTFGGLLAAITGLILHAIIVATKN